MDFVTPRGEGATLSGFFAGVCGGVTFPGLVVGSYESTAPDVGDSMGEGVGDARVDEDVQGHRQDVEHADVADVDDLKFRMKFF